MNSYYVQWLGKKIVISRILVTLANILSIFRRIATVLAIFYFGFIAMNSYLGTSLWINILIMVVLMFKLTLNDNVYQILPDKLKKFVFIIFSIGALYYVWQDSNLTQNMKIIFSIGFSYMYSISIYESINKFFNSK